MKLRVGLLFLLSLSSLFGIVNCSTVQPSNKVGYFSNQRRQPALQDDQWGKTEVFPAWAYDAGPDLKTSMGKELVDLVSEIPYYPGVSQSLLGDQKFRPAFGPIPWRMLQKPNSVKILFIGQDGTHIAEAAGRPATAGFGGRAQDLAKYFGVGPSAAFINAYAFTIRGQDGSANVPVVKIYNGKPVLEINRVVDNNLWMMSRDLNSPIVQWRNRMIEWIIRNNKDSLKMIVTFGKPAQDTAASFVLSRVEKYGVENKGTSVGSRYSSEQLAASKVQVPEFKIVALDGNNEGAVLIGKDGQDLYKEVLGLKNSDFKYDADTLNQVVTQFTEAFKKNPTAILQKMVFSNAGHQQSGIIDTAQIGGYNVADRMKIASDFNVNESSTISLKGLKISDDIGRLGHDVLLVDLPHPTYLSSTQQDYLKKVKSNPSLRDFKNG